MKRFISVLAVVAIMAVMLVVMAAPAFANKGGEPAVSPNKPGTEETLGNGPPNFNFAQRSGSEVYHNGGGGDTCVFHFGKNIGKTSGGDPNVCLDRPI